MKIYAFILPGTSCIEVLIYALKKIMGYEVACLLHKDHDLAALDFTINSLNT